MNIVTIMNYPPNKEFNKMCRIWTDRVIRHGGDNILILFRDHKPEIIKEFKTRANITIEKREDTKALGINHFNALFKLPTLASLKDEFIFLDSDMYVIHDLHFLWNKRKDKPWIGVNHQRVPKHPDTHRPPFLNSGLQIVSDPTFYDFNAIKECHHKAGKALMVPGIDQSILFRYFKSINYDYVHPKIGTEWNSCSAVGKLINKGGRKWAGRTVGLKKDHPVYINHYWCDYKPWKIKCPLHASYKG